MAIIATLDTKGAEVAFVSKALGRLGRSCRIFDIGTAGPYARELLPDEKGNDQSNGQRKSASGMLARIAGLVRDELEMRTKSGEVTAVLGIAGGKGSAAFGAIAGDLPYGFPRILVSSARPALLAELARQSDILFYPTLVDLFGINDFTERVLNNAVNAIAAMRFQPARRRARKVVAITAFGVTTPAASACVAQLRNSGVDSIVFPANGAGGRTMEKLVRAGEFDGVIDLTTTELADELVGGAASAGPERLTAATESGVPQLVAPGAVDMVNFGAPDTVPAQFEGRTFYSHTPFTTLMRTTAQENREIGRITGCKIARAKGPTCVLWPRRGVSDYDREGEAFFDPPADRAWFQGVREALPPAIPAIEIDCHINDPAFAHAAVSWMTKQLNQEVRP
ncbi:Tm-1-like ATP-binding domain-containing protein [Paraburkholderia sp. EG287A]|uniref:Tm-1-like ATP-binding domain-containing protein n=1 Tax=unclassified Paraburkholderia TaxID=2615204 RepID=UPI0034D2D6D0